MRESLILLVIASTGLFSCEQANTSSQEPEVEIFSSEVDEVGEHTSVDIEKFIDTKYEYIDSTGNSLLIENSLPKGGLKYTNSSGQEYVYAIFWTRITNKTANFFEVTIDFPADSFKLSPSASNYFKVKLPKDKMTVDKATLFNYGLTDLESSLKNRFPKPTSLHLALDPKETGLFYSVLLFKKGHNGVVRTGLSLKEHNVFYRVNNKEIHCGQVNTKMLKLK